MRRVIVATLALVFTALVGSADASACAPAPREGEVVRIADEEALIVWDSKKRVEHFVRRASFRSSGADFGFLVPTPSKPELDQMDGAVFQELATKLTPRVIEQPGGTEIAFGCTLWGAAKSASVAAPEAQSVRVLGEQRVAGYDAVILSADDAEALATWLESHGYAKGAALTAWLAPYVQSHWVLTAFKIADPNGESGKSDAHAVGTPAVHMTFPAERAFYPYAEPEDQRETVGAGFENVAVPHRMLRLYFVSNLRYEGLRGDGGEFPGVVKLAQPTALPSAISALAPKNAFLTVFEDTSTPRPGTDDVIFGPASDQTPVEVPPVIVKVPRKVTIPLELVALAVFIAAAIALVVRRRRRAV